MEPSPSYSALQAIGFATGAALCFLLGFLQVQMSRATKSDGAFIWLWVLAAIWNAGNLAVHTLILAGHSDTSTTVGLAAIIAWSAVSFAPTLIFWIFTSHFPMQTTARRAALGFSVFMSAGLVFLFVAAVFVPSFALPFHSVVTLSFASGVTLAVACGALHVFKKKPSPVGPELPIKRTWLNRIAAFLMLVHLSLLATALFTDNAGGTLNLIVQTMAQQWSIAWSIVIAAYLAESSYADIVLKRSLRLIGCVMIAAGLASVAPGMSAGVSLVVATIAGAALLFCAPLFHRIIDIFIDKVALRRPDYTAIADAFAEKVRHAASPEEVWSLLQSTSRDTLNKSARLAETTVDVPLDGPVTAPGSVARLFMQGELAFVRTISNQANQRLEALANENERREAKLREERLQHAVTQAELTALRAQVNPHFLFNTLNSIAELISTEPNAAETMTERLAEFFRYTLTRTLQTLSTVQEELEFARHYLAIETTRFGERLRVQIDGDAELNELQIPSLILQPLVENAVRHGIAPKVGGGSVWVSAKQKDRCIRLCVQDDGVGMEASRSSESGIGLQNVRERLRTLYGDRAVVTITAGTNGYGTSVTLLLPIDDRN